MRDQGGWRRKRKGGIRGEHMGFLPYSWLIAQKGEKMCLHRERKG